MTQIQADISVLYSKLDEFRVNNKYCDVTIRIDEELFKCHRLILAATCEYFDSMFDGNFKGSDEAAEVPLLNENVNAVAFAEVLRFAYTGKVIVTAVNAHSLIVASEFLGLSFIEELCIKYIRRKIPIQNAIGILLFARKTMKDSLTKVIVEYIVTHFHTVSKTEEFLNLPFADFRLLLDQYRDRTYSSRNNDLLLDTIFKWIHYAHETRRLHLHELINAVDFEKISPDYTKYMTRKYIASSDDLTEYTPRNAPSLHVFIELQNFSAMLIFSLKHYNHKYKWHYSCPALPESNDETNVPNLPQSTNFNYNNSCKNIKNVRLDSNHLYSLDFIRQSNRQKFYTTSSIGFTDFHFLRSPPMIISNYEMCALRDCIYLYNRDIFEPTVASTPGEPIPNFNDEELLRGFYGYDKKLDKWFPVAPMKQKVAGACITADNCNLIYTIGGRRDDQSFQGYFQAYDSRTSQWQELRKCDYSYQNAACCMHEGRIYVSGGTGELQRTDIFDLKAGKWQQGAKMNTERQLHRLVSHKGRVWAIGNNCSDLTIDLYDPIIQNWCTTSALKEAVEKSIEEEKRIPPFRALTLSKHTQMIVHDAVVF